MSEQVRPEFASMVVPIDDIQPHPQNVRQGDIGAITVSLQAHGQYKPVLVQAATGYIIAGNHTWKAAKSLGWTEIAVAKLEVDDDKAMRILLADNRSTDLATYDDAALVAVLSEYARNYDMKGLLWDQDDLDEMLQREQTRLISGAFPDLSKLSTDGASNPLEDQQSATAPESNIKTASFFFAPEEFDELSGILAATGLQNRNDALLKVAREWHANR